MSKKIPLVEMIKRAESIVGENKYDYSLIKKENYKGVTYKYPIKCNKCGFIFFQSFHQLFHHSKCPVCERTTRMTTEIFIAKAKKIHGNKYDYSLVDYKNNDSDVLIKCNTCGDIFPQTPNLHLHSHGCPTCSKNKKGTTESFIKRARETHGDKYNYSKVEYINANTDVIIICPYHGEFSQRPSKHINLKQGCPHCKASSGEKEISRLLELKNIKFITEYRFDNCRDRYPLPFDFYLPNYNVCIEYDGIQHYESLEVFGGEKQFINQQKHDSIKTNYCKQNNIPLLRIKYDEDVETRLNQFLYSKCKIESQSIFDL